MTKIFYDELPPLAAPAYSGVVGRVFIFSDYKEWIQKDVKSDDTIWVPYFRFGQPKVRTCEDVKYYSHNERHCAALETCPTDYMLYSYNFSLYGMIAVYDPSWLEKFNHEPPEHITEMWKKKPRKIPDFSNASVTIIKEREN